MVAGLPDRVLGARGNSTARLPAAAKPAYRCGKAQLPGDECSRPRSRRRVRDHRYRSIHAPGGHGDQCGCLERYRRCGAGTKNLAGGALPIGEWISKLFQTIIRSFFGDDHVVNVTLAQAGHGHA